MTIRLTRLIATLVVAVGFSAASAQSPDGPAPVLLDAQKADFVNLFAGIDGTCVIFDEIDGATLVHNPERAKQRFSPWSTFEIPAALIIIESGLLSSVDEVVEWDPSVYPAHPALPESLRKSWESPHSLKSAYRDYAPWFFRDQIRRIPPEIVEQYLVRFHYGNETGTDMDAFWLGKDLTISANEQVAFLQNLLDRNFALKGKTRDEVLPMLETRKTASYTLALKTGSGATNDKAFGWAIGYVDRGSRRYFFAMNFDTDDYGELSARRQEIVHRLLENLGLLAP